MADKNGSFSKKILYPLWFYGKSLSSLFCLFQTLNERRRRKTYSYVKRTKALLQYFEWEFSFVRLTQLILC